ncbi:MAG: tetratricopeptide repeat protein, partial [candidate division WOR-3 bacterium]
MAEQDFTEIARLAERYNKDPKSRIFVQLADAYRKNNMVDEALEVLNQGLQYHPQYPLAHLILGKCYFDKRMYNQAKDALEKTIELDPVNIVALRMLAQVCETLKDESCQVKA